MPNSETPPEPTVAIGYSRAPKVYLALLLLFHLLMNLWWLAADNHPIGPDAALQLDLAEQYYEALTSPDYVDVGERFAAVREIQTIYPPILHLLGALAWLVSPFNTDAMVFLNTLAFLGLIGGVYCFAGTFLTRWQALFAAFIASFTPFLFGGSRLFLQDLMAATLVVWIMWALVKTDFFRNTRWVIAFAVLCAVGVLVRWTTPVYYAFPVAFAILGGVFHSLRGESKGLGRLIKNLILVVVLTGALMAPWYVNNLDLMRDTYTNALAGTQGNLDFVDWQDWTLYLLYIINIGTFLPLFIAAALGLPFILLRRHVPMPAGMTVLWVFGAYLILTLAWSFKTPAPQFILPMLPAMAVLAAIALTSLPGRPIRIAVGTLFSVFLLFQFCNLTFVSFGPIAEIQTPWFADHPHMDRTKKNGLVIYSDKVFAGNAGYFPIYRGDNWQTRVYDVMARHDREALYITDHNANYQCLRISKAGLEHLKYDYLPLQNADSGRPSRHYVGPLVNVTRVIHEGGIEAITADTTDPLPLSASDLQLKGDVLQLPPGSEVVVDLERAVTLDALDFILPLSADGRDYGLHAEYQPAGSEVFQEFSPPIDIDTFPASTLNVSFDSVKVRVLRIVSRGASEPMDLSIAFYEKKIQPRPFVLQGSGDEMDALLHVYLITDYIVAADMTDEEFELISDRFEIIDSFPANRDTHWAPREISVMARKHLQPILHNTEPRLRVNVSDTALDSTRIGQPWWRVPEVDRTITADGKLIPWSVSYPAMCDMDFGRAYEVGAIDLVPYDPTTPLGNVMIQYWDHGNWIPLSEEQPFTSGPAKYKDLGYYEVRPTPIEWSEPIVTSRMRFTFTADSISRNLSLANVFVYGKPAAETKATPTPAEAAQEIFARTDSVITEFAAGAGSGGPTHHVWAMPVRGEGDRVFEFNVESQGSGTVRLAIDGESPIIFPNRRNASGLWALGAYTLVYRAHDKQVPGAGTFRLIAPGDAQLGDTLDLSVLLVSEHTDSTIAIREASAL